MMMNSLMGMKLKEVMILLATSKQLCVMLMTLEERKNKY